MKSFKAFAFLGLSLAFVAAFTVPAALGDRAFHPYSDYLLHDVGTGDGIPPAMVEHYGRHCAGCGAS